MRRNKEGRQLGVTEAARRLGCRIDTLYLSLRAGRVAGARKRNGVWLIPEASIEARLHDRRKARDSRGACKLRSDRAARAARKREGNGAG